MGKEWILSLVVIGMILAHETFSGKNIAWAQDGVNAAPLNEPNSAPGPGTEDTTAPVYTPPPADPQEFSAPIDSAMDTSPEKPQKPNPYDENIDYGKLIRNIELNEQPKGYRHHALGTEGYRPNTIALGAGGRIPGVGALFDYSWNRVGAGISASYRPNESFMVEKNNPELRGTGQTFANIWVHYNWIPFAVSPYFLVGLEYATNTISQLNVIGGIGVEARIWTYVTIFIEYVRHETTKEGFPGAAVGIAF